MNHLLSLCAEGGTAVLLSARNSQHYQVADQTFPEACVDESDIAAALLAAGFDPLQTAIETVPIKTWADLAFNSIVIAIATKRSGRCSW